MSEAEAFARRLASGDPIADPVAVVVAHPDDETLWAGSALRRFRDLTLIHLTDGAPQDMADARRLGFTTRAGYAAARAGELDRALAALECDARRIDYAIPDQQACLAMDELVGRLATDLAGMAAVITHPYEGGHPDHDAAAFAVARAAPVRVEFACYHEHDGARRFGSFWADPACPEAVRPLSPGDTARVETALAAHATQAAVIDGWRPAVERWRAAPVYDFSRAPPPGACLYDRFGWTLTGARWRGHAVAEPVA